MLNSAVFEEKSVCFCGNFEVQHLTWLVPIEIVELWRMQVTGWATSPLAGEAYKM